MTLPSCAGRKRVEDARKRADDPRIHRKKYFVKAMDCRVKCSARTHHRRVFGDMTDTSSLHGFGSKGAIHAMAGGIDHGPAA
jgi:hypothetical protein